MTPIWIFPAYPLLVIGPHAGVLAQKTDGARALDIIVGGFVFQGIGFMASSNPVLLFSDASSLTSYSIQVSLMIYAAFIYRLMTQKLPQESNTTPVAICHDAGALTLSTRSQTQHVCQYRSLWLHDLWCDHHGSEPAARRSG